ncbi:MAG TPA: cytochrome b/b6 domain-containing protein [Micropepsaceae bacterium]|nr:cytochrome b/b6 domain-containing protein [Micropepsaceae bacterium]
MSAEIAGDRVQRSLRTRNGRELIYRHTVAVRVSHWLNLLCFVVLLMSGLQIFNAHAMLHWGVKGDEADPALFSIYAEDQLEGPPIGWLQIGSAKFNTTGVLGVFTDRDGFLSGRAFPWWITLPSYQSLAEGRRWHFFFAWLLAINGFAYLLYGFGAGHFRRDLAPTHKDVRGLGRSILDHLRFRHPRGEAAKRYNVLQKFAYLTVVFVLFPLMIVTGVSMSPGIDSAAPWLPDLFGGRQSARTIHFFAATAIVLFVFIHLIEVLLAGIFNEMRSMITGWFAVRPEKPGA